MKQASSDIAALVVTRGRAPYLHSTLEALAAQDTPPGHIVIVDVGSDGHDTSNRGQTRGHDRLDHGIEDRPGLDEADIRQILAQAPSLHIVAAHGAKTFGQAIDAASQDPAIADDLAQATWWWLLHDDSAPEPECLTNLWSLADRGRTIAAAGPKQVSWDGTKLLEVGIAATISARRLDEIASGEIDQGQYDNRLDVLAVGTAGMLVRSDVWTQLGGTDPALGPFGDGLEFGRRARRAGYRVVVAPKARLRHARQSLEPQGGVGAGMGGPSSATVRREPIDEGGAASIEDSADAQARSASAVATGADPTALPEAGTPRRSEMDASFRARRAAQLYNWVVAVPWWQGIALSLALVLWLPLRALGRVATGNAHLAGAEIRAGIDLVARTPAVWRARLRSAKQATLPRSVLRPLEADAYLLAQARKRDRLMYRQGSDTPLVDPLIVGGEKRHRQRSRGAATVVAALLIGVALVAWSPMVSGVGGAGWARAPLRWTDLWVGAWSSWVPGGDGYVGPPDPLLIPLALLSAPWALVHVPPTSVITVGLFLAIPLAGLSAWMLAARVTTSISARVAASVVWASLPALTISASQGRVGELIVHLLIPVVALAWLATAGRGAHLVVAGATHSHTVPPRWDGRGAAGVASLALVGVVCAAPGMIVPALLISAIVAAANLRLGARLAATTLPGAVLVAPFTYAAASVPGGWAALVSVGGPALSTASTPSWATMMGMPTIPSWSAPVWLAGAVGAALLAAILAAALRHLFWPRHRDLGWIPSPVVMLAGVALSVASAVALGYVSVAATPDLATAWSGPALSLAGVCALIGACSAVSADHPWDARTTTGRLAPGILTGAAVVSLVSWALTGPLGPGGADHIHPAPQRVLPAVSLQASLSERAGRVLVLSATDDALNAQVMRSDAEVYTDASALTRLQRLHSLHEGQWDAASTDLAQ